MTSQTKSVAGWANYPAVQAKVFEPANMEEARSVILEHDRVIARGNGKSYGDAALAPNILSTLSMNQVLGFDRENGIIECEAGVLLHDLLKIMVPSGWFFHVTPGIKSVTVGGAIASDVHGKNHPIAGCFSRHLLSFVLMDGSGAVKTCSRTENPDLFWATCGGMGWTGVILRAKFGLLKITSAAMRQKTLRCPNLDAVFNSFEENRAWSYAAGWIDTTHAGGRGCVFLAEHQASDFSATKPLVYQETARRSIPFFCPSWLLNPLSIRAHNNYYFSRHRDGASLVSLDKYFYPLDAILNWNRLYGRRGFVQYQFCLPENRAFDGIRQVLNKVQKSGETPFLSVLKRHGEQDPKATNAFPIRGYSLALDFPKTNGVFSLVNQLDELVWGLGGKIYLTKDACSAPKMGRLDPNGFGERKFRSLLRERIGG